AAARDLHLDTDARVARAVLRPVDAAGGYLSPAAELGEAVVDGLTDALGAVGVALFFDEKLESLEGRLDVRCQRWESEWRGFCDEAVEIEALCDDRQQLLRCDRHVCGIRGFHEIIVAVPSELSLEALDDGRGVLYLDADPMPMPRLAHGVGRAAAAEWVKD